MGLHPGWEFRLWTDEDAARLVAEQYPALAPTFRSYPFNIQRADVIRCALSCALRLCALAPPSVREARALEALEQRHYTPWGTLASSHDRTCALACVCELRNTALGTGQQS